jgi:quinol monooxygenase YgiN
MEPVRLLNLIHAPDTACPQIEAAAVRLTELARDRHAIRAELMRDVGDACRLVMLLEFRSEEELGAYFADPERLAILDQAPAALQQAVERYELVAVPLPAVP